MEHTKNLKKALVIFLLMVAGMTGYGQSVSTNNVNTITDTYAYIEANVTDVGTGITERGILYGTSSGLTYPSSTNVHESIISPGTTGLFELQITSLSPSTIYYVRAYIISGGTPYYGSELNFTTYSSGSFPYTCIVNNDKLVDATTYQLDIYIYSNSSAAAQMLNLNNYQLAFEVWNVGSTAGTLTGSFKTGTSDLPVAFQPAATPTIFRADNSGGAHFDMVIPGPPASSNSTLIPYGASAAVRIGTFQIVHHDVAAGPATAFPSGNRLNMIWDNDVLGKTVIYAISSIPSPGTIVNATNLSSGHQPLTAGAPMNNPVFNTAQWAGTTSADWFTTSNWKANPTSVVPTSATEVLIPGTGITNYPAISGATTAACNDLTIADGGNLAITPTGSLTVSGNLSLGTTSPSPLTMQSTSSGTGSLIVTGTVSGTGAATVLAERWLSTGAWHMVSSPLSGQSIAGFLTDTKNNNISTSSTGQRGMMDYDPVGNTWHNYFTNTTGGSLSTGTGFSMRVASSSITPVTFTGALQTGTLTPSASAGNWNCLGNPYTSAIGMTSISGTSSNFLTANSANLDPSYTIYMWEKPDAQNGLTGQYTTYSNVVALNIQHGQAFFVKMNTGTTTFNPAMQFHGPLTSFKSAQSPWPTIKLEVAVGVQKNSTIIAFNSGMTKGLDPTYDAGLLKGGSDLLVYSKLVEDNGIPFAIQALPTNDINQMIIPIGLDFKTGGEVTFSAELLNLPKECKAILEDKVTKTFTDLSSEVYKVTVPANSVITDRFELHTGDLVSGLNPGETVPGDLKAYAVSSTEIRVVGNLNSNAVATLYDVSGKKILSQNLYPDTLNSIPTPNLKQGVYVLSVKDSDKTQTFKILIRP